MSNRKRRNLRRRRALTHAERWTADRYRPIQTMTSDELRKILVDDGVARRLTPVIWFTNAVLFIALKDRLPKDVVFQQINDEVREKCGLPLPFAPIGDPA